MSVVVHFQLSVYCALSFIVDLNSGNAVINTAISHIKVVLVLKGAVIGIDDEDDSTFTITADQNRSYYFQGDLLTCFESVPCTHTVDI